MNNTISDATPQFARCAHYGRYSTKMQRPASLEDQERVCRDYAAAKGWLILDEHIYTDAALSGTTKAKRKGLEALETAAQTRPRPFDYALFDDSSRLSRDLGDVLEFEKLMRHYGIKVCFASQQLDSSDPNFMTMLTVYGMVPSPRNSRSGKRDSEWDPGTIKRILHNEKYRGMNVWNVTTQLEHPTTRRPDRSGRTTSQPLNT